MLSLIQNEVVVAPVVANLNSPVSSPSQITPGPIAINSATYVELQRESRPDIWCGILGSGDRHLRRPSAVAHTPSDPRGALLHAPQTQQAGRGGHAGHASGDNRHDRRGGLLLIFPATPRH